MKICTLIISISAGSCTHKITLCALHRQTSSVAIKIIFLQYSGYLSIVINVLYFLPFIAGYIVNKSLDSIVVFYISSVPFMHEHMLFLKVLQPFWGCHITSTHNHFCPGDMIMKARLDCHWHLCFCYIKLQDDQNYWRCLCLEMGVSWCQIWKLKAKFPVISVSRWDIE